MATYNKLKEEHKLCQEKVTSFLLVESPDQMKLQILISRFLISESDHLYIYAKAINKHSLNDTSHTLHTSHNGKHA